MLILPKSRMSHNVTSSWTLDSTNDNRAVGFVVAWTSVPLRSGISEITTCQDNSDNASHLRIGFSTNRIPMHGDQLQAGGAVGAMARDGDLQRS